MFGFQLAWPLYTPLPWPILVHYRPAKDQLSFESAHLIAPPDSFTHEPALSHGYRGHARPAGHGLNCDKPLYSDRTPHNMMEAVYI